MSALRLLLFAGLLAHKGVWEVLKRRGGSKAAQPLPERSSGKRLVKLAKSLALVLLVVQTLFLEVLPITRDPAGLQAVGVAVYLAGLAIALTGRLQLDTNWADVEDFRVLPGQALVAGGIYRYMRHPIYTGDLLLLAGLELALNSWLVLGAVAVAAVFVRQALAEEALLARALPGYSDYCARTKRFIPFLI